MATYSSPLSFAKPALAVRYAATWNPAVGQQSVSFNPGGLTPATAKGAVVSCVLTQEDSGEALLPSTLSHIEASLRRTTGGNWSVVVTLPSPGTVARAGDGTIEVVLYLPV